MTTCTSCPISCLAHEISTRTQALKAKLLSSAGPRKADNGLGSTLMIAAATLLVGLVVLAATVTVAAPLAGFIPVMLVALVP